MNKPDQREPTHEPPARGPNPNPTIRLSLPDGEQPGERIGRYKLLQQIGEGGMGTVWMAEQEEPVRRRVALKVIKLGMDTKQVIGRFEAERQALALMDHPNIAKVLDAGATENGRPFFAMELVKGIPITRYCDDHKLNTEERLKLFTDVCHAIQHAHQKGIIHRDIKPSNILVTLNDGVPMPKVIDFGIAKATGGQTLTDKTVFTALEQFIGTPAYMSPEQAEMNSLDIDTRSDIYALGVLLYELLTGKTPFDAKALVAKGLEEIRRIIRENEPPRPSTRLSTLDAAEQTILANQRHSDPPKLVGIIRGDLDWIVMKTLEKDRTRRYDTANGLAMDVQRYLKSEPIIARPPSQLYRFQKMVRRNKLAFGAGSALIITILMGLGISTWLFVKERQARTRADSEANRAKVTIQALQELARGLLAQTRTNSRVTWEAGHPPTIEEVVAKVTKTLSEEQEELANWLPLAASIHVGSEDYRSAETEFRKAVDLNRQIHGDKHPKVTDSLYALGFYLMGISNLVAAEEVLEVGLANQSGQTNSVGSETLTVLKALAMDCFLQGKTEKAERLFFQVVEIGRNAGDKDRRGFAESLVCLGAILDGQKKYGEAEKLFREALDLQIKCESVSIGGLAQTIQNLAVALIHQNKSLEAEKQLRDSLYLLRKTGGTNDTALVKSLNYLGKLLNDQRQFSAAEPVFREAAELGDADAQNNLALMFKNGTGVEKDYSEAFKWFRRAAEQDNASGQDNLGVLYANGLGTEKDYAEAVKWYRKAAEQGSVDAQNNLGWMFKKGLGVEKDYVAALKWYRKAAEQENSWGQVNLGVLYANGLGTEKDYAEAVKWYRRAADHGNSEAQGLLAWMYKEGWGVNKDLAEAFKWYQKAAERGNIDAQIFVGWMYQNGVGAEKQDKVEAMKWYRKAADQGSGQAQNNLGIIYRNGDGVAKDYGEAVKWFRKAADQTNASAQASLGEMYKNGWGLAKDVVEAKNWYRKAAEQGNAYAQSVLGRMYANGEGMAKDTTEAVKWYRKAADQANTYGQSSLGTMYLNGWGVEKDSSEALKWFRKAAGQGDVSSQSSIGWMYANGDGASKDAVEAVKWYRKAAELGDAEGQCRLGVMYQGGSGVGKDNAESAKWLRKSAEQGNAFAQNAFAWLAATCADSSVRNGRGAVTFAEKAVARTNRKEPKILDTLAAAYAEVGNFTNAVRTQEEGISLLTDEAAQKDYTTRLQLYKANTPYREPEK